MFYDLYDELCKKKGISLSKAAKEIGLSNSTVTKWKKTGATPSGDTLAKIASYFGISIDLLLKKENPSPPSLTAKDQRDIARDLEKLKADLESADSLMFDGNPMSEEARESILAAMKLGLEAAKLKNKETYTPKKYRKE